MNEQHGFDNPAFAVTKTLTDEASEKYHLGYNSIASKNAAIDLIKFFNKYLKGNATH